MIVLEENRMGLKVFIRLLLRNRTSKIYSYIHRERERRRFIIRIDSCSYGNPGVPRAVDL